MGSATTMEEKGSDSGRSNTKDDIPFSTDCSGNGVTDMSLSTSSSAVKEKEVSLIVLCRVNNPIKGELLLWIEVGIVVVDPGSHCLWIISQLLLKEMILDQEGPNFVEEGAYQDSPGGTL